MSFTISAWDYEEYVLSPQDINHCIKNFNVIKLGISSIGTLRSVSKYYSLPRLMKLSGKVIVSPKPN
jgi:hypothetical protein